MGIGQKIIKRLRQFTNHLEVAKTVDDLPERITTIRRIKMDRKTYLEACKEENKRIRENYGPILITYIRSPQRLTLPARRMSQEELIQYYRTNFQNTPIGCVVAVNVDGEIHYGWSLCRTSKDKFSKVICVNRALNRAINGDGNSDFFNDYVFLPVVVRDYLDGMQLRANKYFFKNTVK